MKTLLKLDAMYKEDMVKVILNNPYRMIKDIDGINFKYADKIALSLGIDKLDKRRIKAAILYSASRLCFRFQSTYVSINDIKKDCFKLIDELSDDDFLSCFNMLIDDNEIIREEDRIYPFSLYEAEIGIANYLTPYLKRKISHIEEDDLDKAIDEVERINEFTYNEQRCY